MILSIHAQKLHKTSMKLLSGQCLKNTGTILILKTQSVMELVNGKLADLLRILELPAERLPLIRMVLWQESAAVVFQVKTRLKWTDRQHTPQGLLPKT